jgi:hypothetical protein
MFRGKRALDGLDKDIRDHFEHETQENIAKGMAPEDARRQAKLKFGNVALTKEDTRAVWVSRRLDEVRQDIRYAFRTLRRNPGFAAIVVLTLALGIGANTAIFTLVNALLLRQLPVPEPRQLVQVHSVENGRRGDVFSVPAVQALQDAPAGLAGLFGVSSAGPLSAGPAPAVEQAQAVWVSGTYFSTLRLQPIVGRLLVPSDDTPNASPVAVVSYPYWQRRLGGRADAIGQPILVQRVPVVVVGVTPRGFAGLTVGEHAEVTLPLAALPQVVPSAAGPVGGRQPVAARVCSRSVRYVDRASGNSARLAVAGSFGTGGQPADVSSGTAGDSQRYVDGRAGRRWLVAVAHHVRSPAVRPDGRCRARAPDCLWQRRSPVARSGRGAERGDVGPTGYRCRPHAARAPIVY